MANDWWRHQANVSEAGDKLDRYPHNDNDNKRISLNWTDNVLSQTTQ